MWRKAKAPSPPEPILRNVSITEDDHGIIVGGDIIPSDFTREVFANWVKPSFLFDPDRRHPVLVLTRRQRIRARLRRWFAWEPVYRVRYATRTLVLGVPDCDCY